MFQHLLAQEVKLVALVTCNTAILLFLLYCAFMLHSHKQQGISLHFWLQCLWGFTCAPRKQYCGCNWLISLFDEGCLDEPFWSNYSQHKLYSNSSRLQACKIPSLHQSVFRFNRNPTLESFLSLLSVLSASANRFKNIRFEKNGHGRKSGR